MCKYFRLHALFNFLMNICTEDILFFVLNLSSSGCSNIGSLFNNNNNKSIYKAQNWVQREYSKHIHTQALTHTSILSVPNLIYTQLKMVSKQRL